MAWTCSRCHNQHEDQFDQCWKCASSADPSDAVDHEPSVDEDAERPLLVLPDFSYYSIPPLLCGMMVSMAIRDTAPLESEVPVLPGPPVPPVADFVLLAIGGLLFYVPVVFVILRHCLLNIIRRQPLGMGNDNPLQSLREIFTLPDHICEQRPWFRMVYYGSFGLIVVVPVINLLWQWLAI